MDMKFCSQLHGRKLRPMRARRCLSLTCAAQTFGASEHIVSSRGNDLGRINIFEDNVPEGSVFIHADPHG
jgi:hypothetical protein